MKYFIVSHKPVCLLWWGVRWSSTSEHVIGNITECEDANRIFRIEHRRTGLWETCIERIKLARAL